MSRPQAIVEALTREGYEPWDDRAARVVESWDAWCAAPRFDFKQDAAFLLVMAEHVEHLRKSLAFAGWEAAR